VGKIQLLTILPAGSTKKFGVAEENVKRFNEDAINVILNKKYTLIIEQYDVSNETVIVKKGTTPSSENINYHQLTGDKAYKFALYLSGYFLLTEEGKDISSVEDIFKDDGEISEEKFMKEQRLIWSLLNGKSEPEVATWLVNDLLVLLGENYKFETVN
jgi:hypothetical protein